MVAMHDSGKAHKKRGSLSFLLEELGARVLRDGFAANRSIRFEIAMRSGPAGMHDALRNPLPIEMRDFLDKRVIFQWCRRPA